MQDRYAGDIGDFGKYGLLRALCGEDLRLGVLWYAFEGDKERAPNDGKHIGYLHPRHGDRFRGCAPDLFAIMRSIVCGGERTISAIEKRRALPDGTAYFSNTLTFGRQEPRAERDARRRAWLSGGRRAVGGTDVVFADPDNGFEPRRVRPHHLKGPKYVYYDDLAPLLDGNRSLVVYHHLGMHVSHERQINDRLDALRERFGDQPSVFAVRFRRGTARAYFVLPSPQHASRLRARTESLLQSSWGANEHFDREVYE